MILSVSIFWFVCFFQIFSTKSDMLIHYQQVHKQDMKTFR